MTRISFSSAQRTLALVWSIGFLLNFTLVVIVANGDNFKSTETVAWSWFLPAIVPTLSLVLGSYFRNAFKPVESKQVERFALRLTVILSSFYLLVLGMSFINAVLTPWFHPERSTQQLLQMSQHLLQISAIYLSPLQGIVAIALGHFVVSAKEKDGDSH